MCLEGGPRGDYQKPVNQQNAWDVFIALLISTFFPWPIKSIFLILQFNGFAFLAFQGHQIKISHHAGQKSTAGFATILAIVIPSLLLIVSTKWYSSLIPSGLIYQIPNTKAYIPMSFSARPRVPGPRWPLRVGLAQRTLKLKLDEVKQTCFMLGLNGLLGFVM